MKTKIPFGVEIEFDCTLFLQVLDKYGITGWNNWINTIHKQNLIYPSWNAKENPPPLQISFNLPGIDLSNRYLDGLDLTLVYVSKGNFRDSSLYGAKILIANQCDFSGCDLRTAFFNSCLISGSIFIDAMLDGINWHRAYYYVGMPPIGLPDEIMRQIKEMPPEDESITGSTSEQKKIVCLADIKDASYLVHQGD